MFAPFTLFVGTLIMFLILFLVLFVIIPYLQVSSYKGREGITTYFFPIIGYFKYMNQAIKDKGDIMGNAKQCNTKTSKLMITNFSRSLLVVIRDPQYIKDYIQKQSIYHKGKVIQTLKHLVGSGLLLAEGETWKRHRKIISNSFHFEFLKDNMNVIQNTTREFLNRISPNEYKEYPAIPKVQEITGEIVGRIFFGENLNNYKCEGKTLTLALADITSELGMVAKTPLVTLLGPKILKVSLVPRYKKIMDRIAGFRQVCFDIIRDRKAQPQQGKDLLGALLVTQKLDDPESRFSDDDIVSEFITFFIAGMDTTGHLIGMTLYNLTQYPEYLKDLQEERDKTYNKENEVTTDTLHKMDVLHSLLKETLRFYTPAPIMFGRVATADHVLVDFPVKKGTLVIPELLAAPFDERYLEDPKKFNPARWNDPNVKVDSFAFMPFAAGARNCIGQHLAIIEAKVILSEFLEMFDFKLIEGYQLKMVMRFLYEPEQEILLNLKPKQR